MRILLSKAHSKFKEPISFILAYEKIIDYSILFLMILPNLIWILLDRGMWVSDTSFYGLSTMRLYHTLVHDTVNWWQEMLAISPKPPILLWIGQFFVPVGRLIGNIDSSLLLITFIAQYVALIFLYNTLIEYFKTRSLALIGCLVVASAPIFIGISKQFYVQPVQLATVTWFMYIMACARKWDSVFIVLQLLAASSFAMLVMLSSPAFCIIPGIVSLYQVFKKGKQGLRFGRKHGVLSVVALVLLLSTLSWYFRNFSEAVTYAGFGYNYVYGGIIENAFLWKFAVWGILTQDGFFLLPGFIVVILMVVWVCFNYFKERGHSKHDSAVLLLLVQVIFVITLFATSAHQTPRYVLPLLGYCAMMISWSILQIHKRWFTSGVLIMFLGQLMMVNLDSFGFIDLRWFIHPLQRNRDRNFELMEGIIQITSDDPTQTVLLAMGGLGFFNLDIEYYASKNPEYFTGKNQTYDCVEFMLTSSEIDGDVESTWKHILAEKPEYIVMPNKEIRRAQLQEWKESEHGWGAVITGAVEISERVTKNRLFKKVVLPEYPEIEIYKYVGKREI